MNRRVVPLHHVLSVIKKDIRNFKQTAKRDYDYNSEFLDGVLHGLTVAYAILRKSSYVKSLTWEMVGISDDLKKLFGGVTVEHIVGLSLAELATTYNLNQAQLQVLQDCLSGFNLYLIGCPETL